MSTEIVTVSVPITINVYITKTVETGLTDEEIILSINSEEWAKNAQLDELEWCHIKDALKNIDIKDPYTYDVIRHDE